MGLLDRNRKQKGLVDDQDRVTSDILCIRCGVNLVSLKISEACPNCLHPVSDSVYGDYLVHADPTQSRRLAESASFVRIGAAFLGGVVVIGLVVTLFAEVSRRSLIHGVHSSFDLLFAGNLIAPLLAGLGLGALTNRRTAAYYQARFGNRTALLQLLFVGLALLAVMILGSIFAPLITRNLVLTLWAVVPGAIFLASLTKLMRRVPNSQLASMSTLAMYWLCFNGVILFSTLMLRSQALEDKTMRDAELGVASIYIVVSIGLGIALYRLLVLVEQALHKAAR